MKHNSMKLRIINLIQRQNAVQNIVQSIAQNRETTILKTENPATIPHDQARTSSRDIYMFVSQKNKFIGNAFPDGDVLRIKDIFPDGDVLHIKDIFPDGDVLRIKDIFPDGDVLHIKDIFPDGDVLHIEDVFPDGDVLHIKKCTGGAAHGSI